MENVILEEITIEHSPTMKSILCDNSDRLTGLQELADLLRDKKKEKGISSTGHKLISSLISFEDISDFATEIIRDLLFIKENAHLELKAKNFNINSKR